MPLKQEPTRQRNAPALGMIARAISYRMPIPVTQVLKLGGGNCYPICPRCDSSFDREYTKFCDRCGQHLAWELFDLATERIAGTK